MASQLVRAFVALEIDERTRDGVGQIMTRLRPRLPGLRGVPAEQLHLTLRFLGDSRPQALERIQPLLARAAAACPPRDVAITGLGTFPDRGAPRVLWLGLALPDQILQLQIACEAAAVAVGFSAERRPFRPHLTLGRWRDRAARPDLESLSLPPVELRRLILFRSELRPTGAVHTPLAMFALGSAAS